MEQIMRPLDEFHVGDMVICHGYEKCEGKKGFIEEIITDPQQRFGSGRFYSGKYSIYGLEAVKWFTGSDSHYYGDFLGENLEPTGDMMSTEDLEKFKQKEPNNKGLQKDIDIVIANLGRKSGRNDGRWRDIFTNLQKGNGEDQ